MWSIPQATVGETSQGTWVRWTVVSGKVSYTKDTAISSQRDHIETEGGCAEVETLGESTDVCEGSGESAKGCSADDGQGAEEKDGENEGVRKQQKINSRRERHLSLRCRDSS